MKADRSFVLACALAFGLLAQVAFDNPLIGIAGAIFGAVVGFLFDKEVRFDDRSEG